jgi:rod shape-determining protein MreC
MRNLLNFLAKYNNLLIFLILEGIAILLLTTGNTYHNTRLVKGIRGITRGVEERMSNIREYFNLREVNKILEAENVSLKNRLEQQVRIEDMLFFQLRTQSSTSNIIFLMPKSQTTR